MRAKSFDRLTEFGTISSQRGWGEEYFRGPEFGMHVLQLTKALSVSSRCTDDDVTDIVSYCQGSH